jgi:hypothetical protein
MTTRIGSPMDQVTLDGTVLYGKTISWGDGKVSTGVTVMGYSTKEAALAAAKEAARRMGWDGKE